MRDTRLLQQLADRRSFIVWKLVQRPGEPKPDKVPIWPATGRNCNWMDSAAWMFPAEALAWVQHLGQGYGVGIVLIAGGDLLALDLDMARGDNGGWLPHVAWLEAQFPGAYRETSISGRGRHIIARIVAELLPQHGTRNKDFHMEAYSRDRFIALTGDNADGDLTADHTPAAQRVLAHLFPPPNLGIPVEWTSGPVAEWRGPENDDELIDIGCRMASARAAFGAAATFKALWHGDESELAKWYPPESIGKAYNASAAAMALHNHLAFLTGNDCERMSRLFQMSGLRDTKHAGEQYLHRAILRACASQASWYRGGRISLNSPQPAPTPVSIAAPMAQVEITAPLAAPPFIGAQIARLPKLASSSGQVPVTTGDVGSNPTVSTAVLQPGELPPLTDNTYIFPMLAQQHFAGYWYIEDVNLVMDHRGILLNKDQMDNTRKHWQWPMNIDASKPSKSAWDCFTGNSIWVTPKVRSTYFGPQDPPMNVRTTPSGTHEINSYKPLNIRKVEGDPTPFINHLKRLLPNDWELLLHALAARVQFQGVKFMWAPFIQGTKGNGKTAVAKIFEYCIGNEYTHWPKADQLDEKYNANLVGKILIVVDEMEKFPMDIEPILNSLVTSTRLEIRAMRTDKVMRDVCFNVLFISNDQTSLRCDPDQRRYAPFFCAQQHAKDLIRDGLTEEYFRWFNHWLEKQDGYAICAYYLSTMALPDSARPDYTVRAPVTTSTQRAYATSRTAAEQDLVSAIEQRRDGFRNGWISSHAVDMEYARSGRARTLSLNARRGVIDVLGYIPHPSLPDGFCDSIMPDGNYYRLYIQADHPQAVAGYAADQVKAAYLAAQK